MEITRIEPLQIDELEIVGKPRRRVDSLIKVSGKNNRLVIGNNVHILDAKFDFRGDGNVLILEDNTDIRGGILLHGGSKVRIGAGTKFHFKQAVLEAREATTIDIGERCLISQVRVTTCDVHSLFDLATGERINKSRNITLHDHVWLSFDAMISKGSEIGSGSVVGAKAMVSGTFPANCVIAGNPARVIREGIAWDHRSLDRMPGHEEPITELVSA